MVYLKCGYNFCLPLMHEDNSNIPFSFPHLSHQVVQLIRAAIPGSSSSSSSGNGSGGSVSRGKAVGSHLALILSLSCCPPLCVFVINSPTPRPFRFRYNNAAVAVLFYTSTSNVAPVNCDATKQALRVCSERGCTRTRDGPVARDMNNGSWSHV